MSWLWLTVPLTALLAGGLALWLHLRTGRHDGPTLAPLTSVPGDERWPSLSPDGNFVAFTCSGPDNPLSTDICVKPVGAETIQRLMQTPAAESRPAWSPDGSEIAFSRSERGKELGIFVMSPMGGAERRVSDTGTAAAWTPDGSSLLVRERLREEPAPFGVVQIDLVSLKRRLLTQPQVGVGDWSFDVSPNGETLALIRYERPGAGDLYVMPLKGGEPRRLTDWNSVLHVPAWTPDGTEIVYGVRDRLWRISARAAHPSRGSPIPDIPMSTQHVSISRPSARQRARLAFSTPHVQMSLRRIDLRSADAAGVFREVAEFAMSTRRDIPGPFSPDGSRVAFTSTRGSADHQLWIAASDGAHPRQLTSLSSGTQMLAHAWSPDGTRILFEATIEGNSDLYVISAEGGEAVRLTSDPAIEGLACWSRDGRTVYYTRVVSGMDIEVWRIPAAGGSAMRISRGPASEPQESPDGRFIYHLERPPDETRVSGRLMRTRAEGGEAEQVLEGVAPLYWCVTDAGIYFLRHEDRADSIMLYRFHRGTVERVGTLPFRVPSFAQGRGRLTASRDGRWALVNVSDRSEGDLMLLEDFR